MHRVSAGRPMVRQGFTLVELLVVIAILGILAGLLVWGVNAARVSILKQAQAFEVQSIATAVEAYRNKYGDYPPDGSSWPVMEAHLRKAFPNILAAELALLNPAFRNANGYIRNDNDLTNTHPLGGRVFDPAEALVFFLGGFSNDPQRPITGPGGPLRRNPEEQDPTRPYYYLYNTQRENAFFEFKISRLTLEQDPNKIRLEPRLAGISTDEMLYKEFPINYTGVAADIMPVYIGSGPSLNQGGVPIVYFDSRTYQFTSPNGSYFNFYVPGNVADSPNCARPFLSNEINTSVPGTLLYANNKTYQIMNAGFDNFYGCRAPMNLNNSQLSPPGLVLFTAPGGNASVLGPNATFIAPVTPSPIRYYLPEFVRERPVDDNTSNFIDGPTFGQSS